MLIEKSLKFDKFNLILLCLSFFDALIFQGSDNHKDIFSISLVLICHDDRACLVEKDTRVNTKKIQISAYIMKCYYSHNHCEEINMIINNGSSLNECTRRSEKETWEHVVQSRNTVIMRA